MAEESTFLYPKSRQFPFDKTCEDIVRALEARGWQVPGITVEFRTYGRNFRLVSTIKGDDFKLEFSRPQGRLDYNWNDTAAVSDLIIPRKELSVYDDNSGPTLYVYVGRNWGGDKARFMSGSKVLSKLYGERRWYIKYSGSCSCGAAGGSPHTHPRRICPILLHDNDLGREHDPRGREPRQYRTNEVFDEFNRWLNATLLPRILRVPPKRQS